jgi:hypothetical protein
LLGDVCVVTDHGSGNFCYISFIKSVMTLQGILLPGVWQERNRTQSVLSFQRQVPMQNGTAFHKWDDDITSMTYEDILATAILNKVYPTLSLGL